MLSVAIQAGGHSTRMGTDKTLVDLAGKPLIAHVVDRLRPLQAAETLIVCREPSRFAFLKLPAYTDLIPNLGPIGGLFTALSKARYPHVVMVGCDMPFASPELIASLLDVQTASGDAYDALVPRWQGRLQPLHALYHMKCLPLVAQAIEAGERKMARLLDQLHTHLVDEAEVARLDPDGSAFVNLNTPDDVRAAQARLIKELRR